MITAFAKYYKPEMQKKMKNFLKIFLKILVLALLTAALILPPLASANVYATDYSFSYDPAREGILSAYMHIDSAKGRMTGITPGTTIADLAKVCLPGDLTASQTNIGTGTVISSASANASLTAVVTGDLNGDGNVTITDLLMVKSHILGTGLEELAAIAGDVNYDGGVSISDFLGIKSNLLGLAHITAPSGSRNQPLLILAPQGSMEWEKAAHSYYSDNDSLITVSENGTVSAKDKEGTAFIYALDDKLQVLDRIAVTVLKGGITVDMPQNTYTLYPTQTAQLNAFLNHPVDAPFTWKSSNESICSVDANGKVTAHSIGTATIQVSIPGGSTDEATITVIPPIESLSFGKELYKVKPKATRQLDLAVNPADTGEEIIWATSDESIATVDQNGVVTGVAYGTVTITATGKYSGLSASCQVKICDVKQVAITFDDGPAVYTLTLLDWLKENDVKVTFFLVCSRVPSYKEQAKRIVAEGHELGYHAYNHQNCLNLSSAQITADFQRSSQMLMELTGKTFTVWRAPGGSINQRVLDAIQLPHIMWSLDTRDWESRNADAVYRSMMNNAGDGKIILLHDIHKTSVEGATRAMKDMLAGDYEFLTVTELLSRDGQLPEACVNYNRSPAR